MPQATIQITRYPNRRFYARNESRYVSLAEIEELIRVGNTVEIRDSQTDEDLTRSVLTRIIIEHHPEKMWLFPSDMLHFMLRANDAMSGFLRDYFRHALPYLEYLQQHSSDRMTLAEPIHWVQAWLDGLVPRTASPEPTRSGAAERTGIAERSESAAHSVELAARIAELEARLRQLEAQTGPQPVASAAQTAEPK